MSSVIPEAWSSLCMEGLRSGLSQNESKSILLLVRKLFSDSRIRFLLVFGTLLGVIRESAFIEFDTDLDVAVSEDDRAAILKDINALKYRAAGLFVVRDWGWIISFESQGNLLDVYFFRRVGNKYVSGDYSMTALEWECPDRVSFLGVNWLAPNSPENYLLNKYGSDWTIPIPGKHATT